MLRFIFFSFYLFYGVTCFPPTLLDSPRHFTLKNLDPKKDPSLTCGYASCPKPKPGLLNVHLVAHTHDDVGWLKTVDQYYYGSKSETQKAGVQYILDSVIQELLHDPAKRFIYVETAYFWKWLKQQHDIVRHQVKNLVLSGQLEFTGGGWSMNDEAVTHYQSIIDQMSWGFRKLNESFGDCAVPRVGWQIDPFGHSREMASIFAQMGFDGLFFGRLDYQDKKERLLSKKAEMIWQGSANLGKNAKLFTGALYNTYSPPPGFCFDILCSDEPFIDDKHSPDYNVNERVAEFKRFAEHQCHYYTTNNVLITMGGDFTYQDAHVWYKNMDKLIRYVNDMQGNGSRLNLFYSTPACYLKALNEEGRTWPVKTDDFFPYASDPHSYWTGYFTSRPTLKRFERMGNNFLQVCKQLYAMADLGPEDMVDLDTMREAMGIMQHHDAITGTEKQHVAQDYARKLSEGFSECQLVAQASISKIIKPTKIVSNLNDKDSQIPLSSCLKLNVSECEVSEKSNTFVVTIYNPLSRPVTKYVRFPVTGQLYIVQDSSGKEQVTQLVPIPEPVRAAPGRLSNAVQELVFLAQDLPPLGFRSYYITKSNKMNYEEDISEEVSSKNSVGNEMFSVKFNKRTGRVKKFTIDEQEVPITQDFLYYKGFIGNNEVFENRSSGAYIFRPNGSTPIRIASVIEHKTYTGPLVEEVHQKFSNWVSQVIRVYKGEKHAEFEWMVGPIPIDDDIGKEIISKFIFPVSNEGVFYTDSNGREMLERKINFRPTWKLNNSEPAAGNYYPVTTRIMLRDKQTEFAVITDRAQGGSSLYDGEIELMVHRRLLHDDAFGVGEALNETQYGKGLVARGKHYVIAGPLNPSGNITLPAQERKLIQENVLSPWLFFTPAEDISFKQWSKMYKMEFSGLKNSLPPNIQILTLEPWKGRSLLLRLEHIMEKNDDPELSKPVTIDLKDIFNPFTISSACETTLGANQWLQKLKRMDWKPESNEIDEELVSQEDYICGEHALTITLTPMQIRSFVIEIEENISQY